MDGDGWAIYAPAPGVRDLGHEAFCARSLARSRARRARAAAPVASLRPRAAARLGAGLLAVGLVAGPAVQLAAAAPAAAADGVLREGDSGPAVRRVQAALGVGADGAFGPATALAVRRLQRAHGLTPDGVVGPATRAALGGSGSTTSRVPRATALRVQRALGISPDGVFGPVTRATLRDFQRRHGLVVDGIPGPATLGALGTSAGSAGSASPAVVVAAMRAKLGLPYQWGGNGPDSYDCSGLTQYAFRQAGVDIPRVSYDQAFAGVHADRSQIQAGDLVFWSLAGPGASHVGVATGPTTAISATVHRVREVDFSSGYWSDAYFGARRV